MVSFTSLLLGLSAVAGVLSIPAEFHEFMKRQTLTSSSTGTSGGFYYSFYDDFSDVTYTNGDDGEYSVSWDGSGDFVGGKGWNPGSAQTITYSGTYDVSGGSYLSVYGWTTSPLVEYYIMDCYGDYNPGSAATYEGTVTSDGGTYDIYTDTRTDEPSIEGTATFPQYFSIRASCRVGGTVTTGNHFSAWADVGLDLGTFNYQIVATEAFSGSGSAAITVS